MTEPGIVARPGLRVLLTNDDGIDAPGFAALEDIARRLSDDLWIVAPQFEQSGAAHALTLHTPLRLRQYDERRFAVAGTPTDCVGMAVKHIMTDRAPDLVLSGVNRGSNLADDVTYSGTVAGAMEGAVLGIRSIALSQAYGFGRTTRENVNFDPSVHYGLGVILALLDQPWPDGVFWNVNFPDAAPGSVEHMEITRQGRRDVNNLKIEQRDDTRGHPYFWMAFDRVLSNPPQGTDLRAIYEGRISVTPLQLDLTYNDFVAEVGQRLNGHPPEV